MIGDEKVVLVLPNGGLDEYLAVINKIMKSDSKIIILKDLQEEVINTMKKTSK